MADEGSRAMTVQVSFFAPFRYQLGVTESDFEFPKPSITVGELLDALYERWPRVSQFKQDRSQEGGPLGLSIVVNGRVTEIASDVHDGDRVTVLGPLSGG